MVSIGTVSLTNIEKVLCSEKKILIGNFKT